MSKRGIIGSLVAVLLVAGSGSAQRPAGTQELQAHEPNDYSQESAWLCRPGRQDACAVDLRTTVVAADGTLTLEGWSADSDAPIDCFYVYPTVSTDPTPNSDMTPDPAELNVVRQQFARFGSVCRVYAPVYRQVTLAGLRTVLAEGGSLGGGVQLEDVRDAWSHYLEHDNQGRGFILVGHSQGSFVLTELVRQEIDGKPIQSQMVSAMLIGATIPVAGEGGRGGAFQNIPLCRSASQTGCLIAYSAFRSTIPPPENTRFGRVDEPGVVAACVNPASLEGGSGELHAYLSTDGSTITGITPPSPWVTPERPIETPWVSVPGLLSARCTENEHAEYLEVTVHGVPADPRTDDIVGDLGAPGRVSADWGLHLIDVNLAMGNLLDIARQQREAWLADRR